MEFIPPIETRETDELILISCSTIDDYQAKAVELAAGELKRRGISRQVIERRYTEIVNAQHHRAELMQMKMATEDYHLLEKIWIVIFWPRELFHGWYLRRDGYTLKAKNRITLLLIGAGLYTLLLLLS